MIFAYILPYVVGFLTTCMLLKVVIEPIEGYDDSDYFSITEDEL